MFSPEVLFLFFLPEVVVLLLKNGDLTLESHNQSLARVLDAIISGRIVKVGFCCNYINNYNPHNIDIKQDPCQCPQS